MTKQTTLSPIGIIGGMGPASTNLFISKLIELFRDTNNARNNIDFPKIILSTIPDTDHMTGEKVISLKVRLINEVSYLKDGGASFFVSPCYSIHTYLANLDFPIPLLDIYKSVKNLKKNDIANCKLLVLCTRTTRNSNLAEYHFGEFNTIVSYLNTEDQKILDNVILDLNFGQTQEQGYSQIKEILVKYSFDKVLLACTELSIIDWNLSNHCIIDSLECLTSATFEVANNFNSLKQIYSS